MAVAEEAVYAALRQIVDPELSINIVDLGLVYEVHVREVDNQSHVVVKMTLTTPACPIGPMLVQAVKDILLEINGVEDAEVELVMNPPWTPDRMTEEARDKLGTF